MNLNFRVCGEEGIDLADPTKAKKVFIFGAEESGSSDQYFYLPQSTFASYFTISPTNDPCTVKTYEVTIDQVDTSTTTSQSGSSFININLGDLMQSETGQQIKMIGSLGSYQVRVDKTLQSGVKNVHIKAITRGLVTVSQPLEFRICPKTGGTHTTPGQSRVIANIDVGASGADTEISFSAWAIRDLVEGCAVFQKYSISAGADSTAMNFVQYPMPGYGYDTHCRTLTDCLKIKVTDTSQPRSLDFYLNMHLEYGQETVRIPVSIQIYPCDTASLASTIPVAPEIVLMNAYQNFTFNMSPTYLNLFVSSYPVKCPVLRFELLDPAN